MHLAPTLFEPRACVQRNGDFLLLPPAPVQLDMAKLELSWCWRVHGGQWPDIWTHLDAMVARALFHM